MNVDLVAILTNISQSLLPVQKLITGLGYLLGILMMMAAIGKLKKIGDSRALSGSREKMFIPIAYFLGGAALIFLPSAITVLGNTAFGSYNVLQYSSYNPYNIYSTMKIIIQTAGVIWFVRGCVLLVNASEPGVQHGPKGLAFLCAGILAVNFEGTVEIANFMMDKLMSVSKIAGR